MYIVVGLGNIGREYADTRHNIGFMAADCLSDRLNVEICRENYRSYFGECRVNGQRVVIAKPTTYMNESGWCVRDLMNWYKCEHNELIVLYDDIDLPVGDIRIREKGSSGTHNGMKSIIYQLGYDDFIRIRIGIGTPPKEWELVNYVLGVPNKEECDLLKSAITDAVDAVELIISGKLTDAQAKFNKKKRREVSKDDGNTDVS